MSGEKVIIELPIETYQELVRKNLLEGHVVVKVVVPFEKSDKYKELSSKIKDLYKQRDEVEHELKVQQGITYNPNK